MTSYTGYTDKELASYIGLTDDPDLTQEIVSRFGRLVDEGAKGLSAANERIASLEDELNDLERELAEAQQ